MDLESVKQFISDNDLEFIYSILTFMGIIVFAWIAIRMIKNVLAKFFAKNEKLTPMMENLLLSIIDKVLWIMTLLIALPELGVNIAALATGAGAFAFVITFAFQETLGNFAAGFMISFNKPFRLGHFIEAAGSSGTVKDLNFMSTTLTTADNKQVIIPNSKVWGDTIVNYSATGTRRVDMVIGIGYSSDIGVAVDVINKILTEQSEVHDEPSSLVEVLELADSSVNLAVRFWLNTSDYWSVYFRVNRLIKEQLETAGVELPFPQMDLYIKEGPAKN